MEEKRFKTGVIVGRFYPFHNGHKHLIRTAQEQCEKVFVTICYLPDQFPSFMERKAWIWYSSPGAVTVGVDISGVDSCSPEIWAGIVIGSVGRKPDALFALEGDKKAWCESMSCQHVLVDIDRSIFPVSGSQVHGNPREMSEYLPQYVRAWYEVNT